jgi:amidase
VTADVRALRHDGAPASRWSRARCDIPEGVSPRPLAFPDASQPTLNLSAREQAARIHDGTLRSVDLTAMYLDRIAQLDGRVGAMVHVMAERALAEAAKLDALRARGVRVGPFHGVPTAVKDLHFLRGAPVRLGSRAFSWLWSPYDDRIVRALRRAGFVILGKTSTSELALLPIVETDLHPPTRNPWDLTRSAGGSSGGAGAAVAAGFVPVAPGSDGAGSIRIPSALNGLVGLKPSRHLVPDDSDRIDVHRMTTCGPMGRCVDDTAALLDVLAAPERPGRFFDASRAKVPPLRIGVMVDPPFGETDPRIVACVREAAAVLRDAGHTVEERPRVEGNVEEFIPVYQSLFARIPVISSSRLQPVVRWFRDEGKRHSHAFVRERFTELAARAVRAMGDVDVMLTPTTAMMAPKVGEFRGLGPRELFQAVSPLGAFTATSNLSGYPAISAPFGNIEGMPVGVQLIGRPGDDGTLLALARLLEDTAV